jgi:hypothetical protein
MAIKGGAGVGSQLTYVPGSIYLACPFGGAPLSAVGIVSAVAGPFDIGTVVTRQALQINPRRGEVSIDGAKSDPNPPHPRRHPPGRPRHPGPRRATKSRPPGAIYGQARAFTLILDEPLEGPVYLRSSNHNLPDFVAALHGIVDVETVARIDSKKGGIRATFTEVPDAPISKVVVNMQGGKKGLS